MCHNVHAKFNETLLIYRKSQWPETTCTIRGRTSSVSAGAEREFPRLPCRCPTKWSTFFSFAYCSPHFFAVSVTRYWSSHRRKTHHILHELLHTGTKYVIWKMRGTCNTPRTCKPFYRKRFIEIGTDPCMELQRCAILFKNLCTVILLLWRHVIQQHGRGSKQDGPRYVAVNIRCRKGGG